MTILMLLNMLLIHGCEDYGEPLDGVAGAAEGGRMTQQSLFDFLPKLEPNVGDWAEEAGAIIPKIQLRIGQKVMMDKSTVSHPWFRCGVIEDIIEHEGHTRVIVYDGERQRSLIDYPRVQLHECMPWKWYEKRMERIGKL